ncbi:MAG: sigma-70 family RNA polymerase sigma factor [Planctomycetes bacterium]|nr:sigma-70 family RNA polymerase sigma factor [Planctomycetota bacterium]MBL7187200.1 sigma-70 family RNA polymerase sigma factor [Phycisphaerae bacterium]
MGRRTLCGASIGSTETICCKVAAVLLNDTDGIEDVLHDVFVSFAQTVGQFRLSGSLKGYLSICVANCARDKNRAMQRQRTVSLDETEPIRPAKDRPDDLAVRGELSEQLDYAMAQLPYEQREVIVLHLQSKMKFRQIAGAQGVSINTVMSRYRYGLDKLRSILNGELKR